MRIDKLPFKRNITEEDIKTYNKAMFQRMVKECVHCAVNIRMADLVALLQVKIRKLEKKGYEFQKLRDALHAKDVKIQELKEEIKAWKKEHKEYKKLVKDRLKVKHLID